MDNIKILLLLDVAGEAMLSPECKALTTEKEREVAVATVLAVREMFVQEMEKELAEMGEAMEKDMKTNG